MALEDQRRPLSIQLTPNAVKYWPTLLRRVHGPRFIPPSATREWDRLMVSAPTQRPGIREIQPVGMVLIIITNSTALGSLNERTRWRGLILRQSVLVLEQKVLSFFFPATSIIHQLQHSLLFKSPAIQP